MSLRDAMNRIDEIEERERSQSGSQSGNSRGAKAAGTVSRIVSSVRSKNGSNNSASAVRDASGTVTGGMSSSFGRSASGIQKYSINSRISDFRNNTGTVNFTRSQRNQSGVSFDRENPTLVSTLAQMYRSANGNDELLKQHFAKFQQEISNPDSPIWNPYFAATSTSKKYYESNEAATQKAEQQLAEAAELLTYWAQRKDLNLSDDEILARVDLNKYSEIKKMNNTFSTGKYEYYTRPVNYTPDWAYGVIWAARNNGGTGNTLSDLAAYGQGLGHTYLRNDNLRELYDATSDRYNPYNGSAQLEDAQLYFRASEFAPTWLQENRYLLNGSDDDRKYYDKVRKAENTTLAIEEQYAELQKRLPYYLENYDDRDVILEKLYEEQLGLDSIEGRYGGELDMLRKMDESLLGASLLGTTRPIQYSRYDLEQQVDKALQEKAQRSKGAQYVDGIVSSLNGRNTISDTDNAINAERDIILNNAKETVLSAGTNIEKTTYSTYAAGFDRNVQEIVRAYEEGTYTATDLYDNLIKDANRYALGSYFTALDNIAAYERLVEEGNPIPEDLIRKNRERLDAITDRYAFAARVASENGLNTKGISSTLEMMNWIYANGKEYVAPTYTLNTAFEAMQMTGVFPEKIALIAETSAEQARKELVEINRALAFLDNNRVIGAYEYERNLKSRRNQLERDMRDAEYYVLQTTAKDFDEVVARRKEELLALKEERDKKWFTPVSFIWGNSKSKQEEFDISIAAMSDGTKMSGTKYDPRMIYASGDMRQFMTQKELDTYLYISATQGHASAQEYFDNIRDTLKLRFNTHGQVLNEELAEEHPILATVSSIALSPAQSIGSMYGIIQTIRGEEINPYDPAFFANAFIGTTRGTVKENIGNAIENPTLEFFAQLGYDAVTSSADSLLAASTGAGLGLMAAEAASGSLMNAKLSGATNEQALVFAGCTAFAETITEKVPLDMMVKAFKQGKSGVLNIIKSAVSEGFGEMGSEVIQNLSERAILGELSGYETEIQALVDDGMERAEAEKQVQKQMLQDLLYTGLVGGVSGGVSTGAASIAGRIVNGRAVDSAQNTNTLRDGAEQVVQENKRSNELADGTEEIFEQTNAQTSAQTNTEASARPDTNYKEYDVDAYKLMGMLTNALQTGDRASQAEAMTAAFESAHVPHEQARAAARSLVYNAKDISAEAVRQIISEARRADISVSEAVSAVTTLTLANDASLKSVLDAPAREITSDTVRELVGKAKEALADPKTSETISKAIYDSAVADAEAQMIADGALAGLESYESAVTDAKRNVKNAEANLQRAEDAERAAADHFMAAYDMFNKNPGDQKTSQQFQNAVQERESAAIVRQQQEQHLANMREQLENTRKMLNSKRSEALKDIRAKAKELVDRRRAEVADAQAADRAAVEMAVAQMAEGQGAFVNDNVSQTEPTIDTNASDSAARYTVKKPSTIEKPLLNPVQTARNLFRALDTKVALGTRKMDRGLRGEIPAQLLSYYENRANYVAVREGSSADFNQTMFIAGNVIQNKIGMDATPQMVEALPKEFSDMFTPKELPDAAVAEFVRMYMMDPERAVSYAGFDYVNRFEKAISKAGLAKAIHQARDNVQAYMQAETLDRVRANVVDATDAARKPTLGENMRKFITRTFDWTNPLYSVDAKVKENTGEYGAVQQTAKRRNVSRDIAANLIRNGLAAPDGRIVDASLSDVLEPISAENADEFFRYALLKHSIDRDVQNKPVFESGITADDRISAIEQLENSHSEYAPTLRRFNNWWQTFVRYWLVDTGLLSEDNAELVFSTYPNYVPTTRDVRGAKSRFDFGAKGSEKPVINPIDSIADRINEIVDAAQKNLTAISFHEAFQNSPGLGMFAREITSDMERIEIDIQDRQKKVKDILQENNVDNDVIADILNVIGSNVVKYADKGTSTEGDVLRVNLPNGKTAYYQFDDALIYEALTGNGKARPREMNRLLKIFSGLTSFMSRMATTFAPTFAASNPLRDIHSSVNYGSWATNYVSAIPKLISSAISIAKNDATYREYKALGGGERKSIQVHDIKGASEYRNMLIKNYYKIEKHGRLKHAGKVAVDVLSLSHLNEVLETMSRLAEYKHGKHDRSTGYGRMKAFQAAQDVTTDFGGGGSSEALITARALVPFLNPNLQGVYRAGREFTGKERSREGVRFAKRAFNTALVCSVAAILRSMFGDEEDRYADIADDIKNTNIIVPNVFNPGSDRRFVRIPISQDPFDQFVFSLINSAIEEYDGTDDFVSLLLSGAKSIIDNATLGVVDATENLIVGEKEKALNSLTSGTVFGPVVGAALNLNYFNSPIVSEYASRTPSLQYDETTPDVFIMAADLASRFGMGLSPQTLEYLYNQYTGYGGQLLTGTLSGKNPVSSVLEAFHKRFTIDPAYTNDISSAYAQNKAFLDNFTAAVDDKGLDAGYLRADLTDDERTAAYEEAVELKNGLRKETNKAISDLYDELDSIRENDTLTNEQRNMLILDYRDRIAEQQVSFNEVMGEFYAKYVTGEDPIIKIITGHQSVMPLTDFEKLDDVFVNAFDNGAQYMQRSFEVWDAAPEKDRNKAVPHPLSSFDSGGVTYDVQSDTERWNGYVAAYSEAYKAAVESISVWDDEQFTLENKLDALKEAHSRAHKRAKEWYLAELAKAEGR